MKKMIYKHYHIVIAAVLLLQLGAFGSLENVDGLFILPITQAMGISRSHYSMAAIFPRSILSFVTVILSGPVALRFGYKKMVLVGLAMSAGGYMWMAAGSAPWVLTVGMSLVGISVCCCGMTNTNRVVKDWFHRKQGMVLGIVSAATGLGGSLWCMLLTPVMEARGWTGAFRVIAAVMTILLVLNLCLVRNKPEEMGLRPYGEGEAETEKKKNIRQFGGHSFHQLLRKPVFYLMVLVLAITYTSLYLPNSVMITYMQDQGLAERQAVQIQSIVLLAMTGTKILTGLLADKIGVRKVVLLCCVMGGIAMLLLPGVSTYGRGIAVVLIYACARPLTSVILPLLTLDLFGSNSYTTTIGVFCSMISIGLTLSSPISNFIFDGTGSYVPAFIAGAVAMLALPLLYLGVFRLADRERTALEVQTM